MVQNGFFYVADVLPATRLSLSKLKWIQMLISIVKKTQFIDINRHQSSVTGR